MDNCNSGYSNWFKPLIPDVGIQYTGVSIPALGICNDMTLSQVEATLLQQILNYSTGIGISIPSIDLSTCALFTQDLVCCSTCTDLPCLLQAYKTALCTLYGDITTLQNEIGSLLTPNLNVGCLSNVTSSSSLAAVLQELLLEFCSLLAGYNTLQTTVTGITNSLATNIGNFLLGAITTKQSYTSEVIKTGAGATASIQFQGFVPVGSIIPYVGPMNVFDATGLGYPGTSAYGFALCNGNNNTYPMAGLGLIGTTDVAMGTPPITLPAGTTYPFTTTAGTYTVTLTSAQVPSLPISISMNHTHPITGYHMGKSTTGTTNIVTVLDINTPPDNDGFSYSGVSPTQTFNTLIGPAIGTDTGVANGGGQSHPNVQPVRAVYFIQRII